MNRFAPRSRTETADLSPATQVGAALLITNDRQILGNERVRHSLLDRGLVTASRRCPVTLYRGLDENEVLDQGDVFTTRAYTSLTERPNVAIGHADATGTRAILMADHVMGLYYAEWLGSMRDEVVAAGVQESAIEARIARAHAEGEWVVGPNVSFAVESTRPGSGRMIGRTVIVAKPKEERNTPEELIHAVCQEERASWGSPRSVHDYMTKHGFSHTSDEPAPLDPQHPGGEWHEKHTYAKPYDERETKNVQAFLKRNEDPRMFSVSGQTMGKGKKGTWHTVVTHKKIVNRPLEGRSEFRIPYQTTGHSVGDYVVHYPGGPTNGHGIIGVGTGAAMRGRVKELHDDGTASIHEIGGHRSARVPSAELYNEARSDSSAARQNGYVHPPARGTNRKALWETHTDFMRHPDQRDTVSLSGVNRKTGKREMLDTQMYADQINNNMRDRGFHGANVPHPDWWKSMSAAERKKYLHVHPKSKMKVEGHMTETAAGNPDSPLLSPGTSDVMKRYDGLVARRRTAAMCGQAREVQRFDRKINILREALGMAPEPATPVRNSGRAFDQNVAETDAVIRRERDPWDRKWLRSCTASALAAWTRSLHDRGFAIRREGDADVTRWIATGSEHERGSATYVATILGGSWCTSVTRNGETLPLFDAQAGDDGPLVAMASDAWDGRISARQAQAYVASWRALHEGRS